MLEVRDLTKEFGDETAVESLSFEVKKGEFVTLLGPSGCGKTTALKAVAGLVEPDGGRVFLRGEDVTDTKPEERRVGMVFQTTSLFPRMTVRENVEYALKPHVEDGTERGERADDYLGLVRMTDKEDALPETLSGGEARRAELARALSYEPDVMLLDEPLTGLDRALRNELKDEIKRVHDETGVTTVLVTHDQEEAISVSDRVVVLNDGEKEQEGTPRDVYRHPRTRFVAEFVGESSRFDGVVGVDGDVRVADDTKIRVNGRGEGEEGDEASVYVRPENVEITEDAVHDNAFAGDVVEVTEMGSHAEARVRTRAGEVLTKVDGFSDVTEGDEVVVGFDDSDAVVVSDDS
ncbi:MAG: ABC transporter ATP-binding protein [Halobacteriales archaeon]|nr:ABC transporter ATP-binding protein [Halobacteriales archaeon]